MYSTGSSADYISTLQQANLGNHQPCRNFISCMVWESQREYLRLLDALAVEDGAVKT